MSGALYNLAAMTVASTGTGTITLGSAAKINGVQYLSFASAGVPDGQPVYYSINDPGGSGASEVGIGTYTSSGTTLTRSVITSTNANAAINMSASAIVRISPPTNQFREVLTASRTYYVLTTGSDSNNGLTNTSSGAFLTIQKAIDTVGMLDCSIYDVSIQVGAGTYAPITLKSFLGAGKVTITGDTTTPANVIISSTSTDGVGGSNVIGRYKIEGFKFTNATSGSHIKIYNTYLEVGANEYGTATTAHIWLEQNAYVEVTANYAISGGATRHLFATTGGVFVCSAKTVTITGTPAFSTATVVGSRTGVFNLPGNTYSGSATGSRYIASFNAVIDVAGGGATYLPGNAGGTATTGGQYA